MANTNGGDLPEEIYQKIKSMKQKYLPALKEMYQKLEAKQQEDSLPQQQKSHRSEKSKQFKAILRMIQFLSVSTKIVKPELKDKVDHYEKQITDLLNHMQRS